MEVQLKLSHILGILVAFLIAVPSAAFAGSWSGPYVGLETSYVNGIVDYANPGTPEQSLSGAMLGAVVGYDYELNNGIVLGIGADVMAGNLSTCVRDGNYIIECGKIDAMIGLNARIGYDLGAFMPYLTAGVVGVNLTQTESCPGPSAAPFGFCHTHGPFDLSQTQMVWGTSIGAGVEIAMAENVSISAEYQHQMFGPTDFVLSPDSGGNDLPVSTANFGSDTVKVGLHFRF